MKNHLSLDGFSLMDGGVEIRVICKESNIKIEIIMASFNGLCWLWFSIVVFNLYASLLQHTMQHTQLK